MTVKITYEWDDGSKSEIVRASNGSWYLEGSQAMAPDKVIEALAFWIGSTYNVPNPDDRAKQGAIPIPPHPGDPGSGGVAI